MPSRTVSSSRLIDFLADNRHVSRSINPQADEPATSRQNPDDSPANPQDLTFLPSEHKHSIASFLLRARLRLLPGVTGRLDVNSDRQSFALHRVALAGRSAFGPVTATGTRFAGDTMPPTVNVGRIKLSAAPASFGCQFRRGSVGSVFPVAIQTAAPRPDGVGRVSPESLT